MKKLLLVLLALTMVFSSLPAFASAAEAKAPDAPFYFVNWEESVVNYDNVTGLPQFYVNPEYSVGDDLPVQWGSYDIDIIAQRLKAKFDALPEGMRYITYMAPQSVYRKCNESVIYLDEGVDMVRNWITDFLETYKEIGGQLDGIVLDLEYVETAYNYIYSNEYKGKNNITIYYDIVNHPQYRKLRPMLEERGFKFYPNPTKAKPEIYGICPDSGSEYSSCRAIWDAVMHDWKAMYLNEMVYEPLKTYFPDAYMDDYDTYNSYAWLRTPGTTGQGSDAGGNTHQAGVGGNIYTYAHRPGPDFFNNYNLPLSYYGTFMEDTAFTAFRWDMLYIKDMVAAQADSGWSAWVTYYDYRIGKTGHAKNTVSGSPYHTETQYHIGMMNPEVFLGYIVASEVAGETGQSSGSAGAKREYDKRIKNFSDIMNELTRVAGYSDREYIPLDYEWSDEFVLTGMYAGGRNIWRITPDVNLGISREEFKIKDSDPTFYINGQTITFPQGAILEETKIEPYGSVGYWVETPKDVMPVITTDADRFDKFPSFGENFEKYEAGTKFTTQNARPLNYWEARVQNKAGNSATVAVDKENSANKVLELLGDASLRVVNAPKKVTAGDTYAKQQAWSVTVTIPSGMSADANIVLLGGSDSGDTKRLKDGGFKIEGGKVYYADAEDYKEFDKLDVSSGGKFIFKRELNLANAEALTSSYYVYNSAGKLVAEAKDVPMYELALPIHGVTLACKGITGSPVIIDDFKLRALGLVADFTLYDAELGMKVETPQTARAKSTAYRLSWMNATTEDQEIVVMAAQYDSTNKLVSEEAIKTVKTGPSTNGVETGIVEVAEGNTLLVYLKGSEVQGPGGDNTGDNNTGNNNKPDVGSSTGNGLPMAVAIAVPAVLAVVAAALWVYAFILLKRKKSAGK